MKKRILDILLLWLAAAGAMAGEYQYQPGKGMLFSWTTDDHVGTYTTSGSRMYYSVTGDITDRNAAMMSCGWALVSDARYYSYAPYSSYYLDTPVTELPITYDGQTQAANGSTSHLASFDYMAASAQTDGTGATFNYSHLGCILRLVLPVKKTATFKSVTLTVPASGESLFVTEATMDLTTLSTDAVKMSETLVLTLDNIMVEEGSDLVAYFMMAPADFTGMTLHAALTKADGTVDGIDIKGMKLLQGMIYNAGATDGNEGASLSKTVRKSETQQISAITCIAPDFGEETLTAVVTGIEKVKMQADSRNGILTKGAKIYESANGTIYALNGRKYLMKR